MSYTHQFSDALFSRVQRHAIPLVDTIEDVLGRALDALEVGGEPPVLRSADTSTVADVRTFNPATAPDLTHTTLLSTSLNGRQRSGGVSWNSLMQATIEAAAKNGLSAGDLMKLMEVPAALGNHGHYSYTFIPDAGISIQGQNANRAWKQVYKIAAASSLCIDVTWVWQSKDKAHMPGITGSMAIGTDLNTSTTQK